MKYKNINKHSEIFQLKQNLLFNLKDKLEFAKIIHNIKNSGDYSAITVVSRELSSLSPSFSHLIYGNLFPKSYEELGACNPYFIKPKSIENEIRWIIHQIQKNKDAVSTFAQLRETVENDVLLGNYDQALSTINDFQSEYGISIWTIEHKLIIFYLQEKTEKVLELVSEINKKQKSTKTGFVPYLTYMLYKRSNPKLSAYDFDNELASVSKRNRGDFLTDRYNYFEFKLNYYNTIKERDFLSNLLMDSTNSMVDRYESLIRILIILFVNDKCDRKELANIAQKLYRTVEDKRLLPIVAFSNQPDCNYYDQAFISVLDYYYTGCYEQCICASRDYIKENPSNLDVLKIYCRSLLFLGENYVNVIHKEDLIINKIGNIIYDIMNGGEIEKNIYPLYQIFKNINDFSISAGLYCFINEERNKRYNKLINLFSTLCFDPFGVYMYDDADDRLKFLKDAANHLPSSKTLEYKINRYGNLISGDTDVVSYIRDVDNACILFNKGSYDDCINLLMDVEKEHSNHIPIVQNSVRYIFDSYVKKEDFTSAISYYVQEYIKDEALVTKVDTSDLSNILHHKKYKGVRYNIDFLIFMFVSQQTDTARSAVLERYCGYQDVDDLSELLPLFADEEKEKVEALVYSIVTSDVLRHTKLVSSTKQIMDVDNLMLQYVLQNNPLRKDDFIQLNEQLAAEMIVYSGMRKMDDSLIFANVPAIIKYELNDVEPLYEQFKAHLELSHGSTCFVIFSKADENDKSNKLLAQSVHYTDSSLLDTSYQLFNSIMYPFLKSKFGIGTYLSTRIRHGVFETNLQSVFISQGLMLQIENGKYIQNSQWFTSYSLSQKERAKLFEILSKFSSEINSLIQAFKRDVLQIRIEEDEKGCFDYRLEDNEICMAVTYACNQTNDFESFCKTLIDYLWQVTDRNLKEIRNLINTDLNRKFNDILDTFASNIKGIGNDIMQNELSNAINNARTDLNLHLNKIERWFYIQDCKFDDFSFETHLNIIWNLICETHPSIKCELVCNEDLPSIMISGEYGIHLSDLLHIFFANMINHSKKERIRHFLLTARQDKKELLLHFENDFDGDEDYTNKKIAQLLQSHERLQKEGGSGLVKARKIVKYDLGDISNEVAVVVKNGKCIADININIDKLCARTDC